MEADRIAQMDRLGIDSGIRELIGELWDHGYETSDSCEGHGNEAYVLIKGSGDGWFENNSQSYGLTKVKSEGECRKEFEDEVRSFGLDPNNFKDKRKVYKCGAGVNGYSNYQGILTNPA